eukprot:scaffold127602_cov60-Cyclotella_meneghiniana.AAC.1
MEFTASDFEGIESKINRVLFQYESNGEMIVYADSDEEILRVEDDDGVSYDLSDNIEWEQIGQSIGRSTMLRQLRFRLGSVLAADDFPPQWASSIAAFFNGLKHNTSLEFLDMAFSPRIGIPDFDLGHFVANNKRLQDLVVLSREPLLSDQGRMIASSIGTSSSLKKLDLSSALFEHADSFRQIVSACSNIEELYSECNRIYQCNAIADLLRNPETKLNRLLLAGVPAGGGMPVIAVGLKVNKSLKKLQLEPGTSLDIMKNILEPALCDASSIESIQNSNHTLESIAIGLYEMLLSEIEQDCLKLNKIEDKDQVIRQKTAKYYFIGDYDVSPFAAMPLSAMPKVISTIGGVIDSWVNVDDHVRLLEIIPKLSNMNDWVSVGYRVRRLEMHTDAFKISHKREARNQCSAIFRMLKTIPELTYVRERDQQTDN